MEWMLMPLKRYADFSGRSRRKEFWLWYLFVMIMYFVLMYLDTVLGLGGSATGYAQGGSVGFNMTGGVLTTDLHARSPRSEHRGGGAADARYRQERLDGADRPHPAVRLDLCPLSVRAAGAIGAEPIWPGPQGRAPTPRSSAEAREGLSRAACGYERRQSSKRGIFAMEWMFMPLKRYADFSGRSRRMEFWMWQLFQVPDQSMSSWSCSSWRWAAAR